MSNLNGKIVLITGGTSGYGKATAAKLVKEGATVIISARKQNELEESKASTGCADIIKMDVTKVLQKSERQISLPLTSTLIWGFIHLLTGGDRIIYQTHFPESHNLLAEQSYKQIFRSFAPVHIA